MGALLVGDAVEVRALALRENRELERHTRGVGAEDCEAVVLVGQPRAGADFIRENVLEDGAFLRCEECVSEIELALRRMTEIGR